MISKSPERESSELKDKSPRSNVKKSYKSSRTAFENVASTPLTDVSEPETSIKSASIIANKTKAEKPKVEQKMQPKTATLRSFDSNKKSAPRQQQQKQQQNDNRNEPGNSRNSETKQNWVMPIKEFESTTLPSEISNNIK